jgi:hypothetical protein
MVSLSARGSLFSRRWRIKGGDLAPAGQAIEEKVEVHHPRVGSSRDYHPANRGVVACF